MIDVSVVVATCGSDEWKQLGDEAMNSAFKTGAQVVRVHLPAGTVAEARNAGLKKVNTEYIVFLDADDSLDPRYFINVEPKADVMVTAIKYPYHDVAMIPKVWQHENYDHKIHFGPCRAECLVDGNYVHVGAIAKTEAVRAVNGFREYPVYEDWALWLSMQQNGATFDYSLTSIYYAATRQNDNHRNGSIPLAERNKIHEIIMSDLVKGEL